MGSYKKIGLSHEMGLIDTPPLYHHPDFELVIFKVPQKVIILGIFFFIIFFLFFYFFFILKLMLWPLIWLSEAVLSCFCPKCERRLVAYWQV